MILEGLFILTNIFYFSFQGQLTLNIESENNGLNNMNVSKIKDFEKTSMKKYLYVL